MKKAKTTVGIKDIAARAGVSIATVSHALRNPGRVSDATRAKVLEAVDEVGYTPNKMGVNLRTAKSGNIVAIIPDVGDTFNFGVIKAIEDVAYQRGYSVLLGDTQGSEKREREYAAMVNSRQADGIILFSHRLPFTVDHDKPLADQIPPLVNSCELVGVEGLPVVTIDNEAAARDATEHLLGFGHRAIAVVTGDMESPSSQARLTGFRQAMADAGLVVDESLIVSGGYSVDGGVSATAEILMQKERPTAIFCFGDEMALSCMSTLRERGFSVPGDISVIGFDDIHFAKYLSPSLTTIAQPTAAIGTTCANLLLDLIDGKTPEKSQHIMPHELIVRESTGPVAS